MIYLTLLLLYPLGPAATDSADDRPSLPAGVRAVLDKPDEFTLFSLKPLSHLVGGVEKWTAKGKELFHGEGVVGKIAVKETKDRERVVSALHRAVAYPSEGTALCFIPHHGIRARKGKETVEIVICFTCSRIHLHTAQGKTEFQISDCYKFGREFDVVLTRLGVPLEPKEP